jgi:hypothetical protein
MMTYISEEPACLAQILRDYRQKLAAIEDFARQHPVRRILLLATGSSLNAALCARYFFEQRFGVLVEIKEPYNFTHYEAVDPHTDLVVAISQSGKSASTLAAMRKVQALSLPVFALTSDPQSPIARACDGVLDINTGIESVGFVTRGFSATVLNLLLMALMIARAQGKPARPRSSAILPNCSGWRRRSRMLFPAPRGLSTGMAKRCGAASALSPPAMARWWAWRRSSKPNLPRRCACLPADLSLRPICTAPIWRRTPVT